MFSEFHVLSGSPKGVLSNEIVILICQLLADKPRFFYDHFQAVTYHSTCYFRNSTIVHVYLF